MLIECSVGIYIVLAIYPSQDDRATSVHMEIVKLLIIISADKYM